MSERTTSDPATHFGIVWTFETETLLSGDGIAMFRADNAAHQHGGDWLLYHNEDDGTWFPFIIWGAGDMVDEEDFSGNVWFQSPVEGFRWIQQYEKTEMLRYLEWEARNLPPDNIEDLEAWEIEQQHKRYELAGRPRYNPEFGDGRTCFCGHPYHRHFDSYEDMLAVGCKYCDCYVFGGERVSK